VNHLELYKEILRHVEVAIKELDIASSLLPMEDTSAHRLTKVIDVFEERLHVLTHENASAVALDLEDVKKQLSELEVMGGFEQFSREEIEQIVKENWSVGLVKKIHASINQKTQMSLEQVSSDIKLLQQHWLAVQ
jgi:uncharacterized protein (UPF0264 family)